MIQTSLRIYLRANIQKVIIMKLVRSIVGVTLIVLGILFTILPGSILFVLGGLVLLSMDHPPARRFLGLIQRQMSVASKKLDMYFHRRKYK